MPGRPRGAGAAGGRGGMKFPKRSETSLCVMLCLAQVFRLGPLGGSREVEGHMAAPEIKGVSKCTEDV